MVKGESFDVDTVAGETLVRGVFAAMGGAAPVVNNIFTGTVTKEAQHLDMIAGIAGGFWTENLKEMTKHGIKPPSLWPALPSR